MRERDSGRGCLCVCRTHTHMTRLLPPMLYQLCQHQPAGLLGQGAEVVISLQGWICMLQLLPAATRKLANVTVCLLCGVSCCLAAPAPALVGRRGAAAA